LPLTLHIIFISIRTVPVITIALNGQSRLPSLNHKVDTFSCNFVLR
jgi:hypothetical protein